MLAYDRVIGSNTDKQHPTADQHFQTEFHRFKIKQSFLHWPGSFKDLKSFFFTVPTNKLNRVLKNHYTESTFSFLVVHNLCLLCPTRLVKHVIIFIRTVYRNESPVGLIGVMHDVRDVLSDVRDVLSNLRDVLRVVPSYNPRSVRDVLKDVPSCNPRSLRDVLRDVPSYNPRNVPSDETSDDPRDDDLMYDVRMDCRNP